MNRRTRTTMTVLAAGALSAGITLAATGQFASADPRYNERPQSAHEEQHGVGADFRSPGPNDRASVTAAAAVDSTRGAARGLGIAPDANPEVRLARFTDTMMRPTDAAGRQGRPTVENRLVWRIIYPQSPLVIFGPGNIPADELVRLQDRRLSWTFIVDAESGEEVEHYQTE